jgi:hypothetical protein
MSEFDPVLMRAFAEAPEPADEGFTARVGAAVAGRERLARLYGALLNAGIGIAGFVVLYVLYGLAMAVGQDFVANVGIELTRAQGGALRSVSDVVLPATDMFTSVGASLTQLLLITAALAGGAVAYRATQD